MVSYSKISLAVGFLLLLTSCGAPEVAFNSPQADSCIPIKYPQSLQSITPSDSLTFTFKRASITCHIRQIEKSGSAYHISIKNNLSYKGSLTKNQSLTWFISVIDNTSGKIVLKKIYKEVLSPSSFTDKIIPLPEKELHFRLQRIFSHMNFSILIGFQPT